MPSTSVVWMVHARTALTGVKGMLLIEQDDLVFRPQLKGAGDTRVRVELIRRVHRVRGTPILEIYPNGTTLPTVLGFYFVEPPKIGGDPTDTPYAALNPFRAHSGRRNALRRLRLANSGKKDEVQGWVEELRSRLGREGA
jgi:hypothetical protein